MKEGAVHSCTPSSSVVRPAQEAEQSLLDLGFHAKLGKALKNCPTCSSPISDGRPHDCGSDPTIKSGKPGAQGDASPGEPASQVKLCQDCGESYVGDAHANCPAAGTIMVEDMITPAPASRRSSLRYSPEETPTKVRRLLGDPSKTVNQYVLVEVLGKGGMGTVWRAWDQKLTRWVALKFLTLDDDSSVKRFEREARLAARLRHPNITPIFEVGEHDTRHYIVMELIDGRPLQKAELTIGQTLEVIVKVGQGLHAAHQSGVIHRDLKPENVLVTPQGWPYIMDFGLAKAVAKDSSLSASGDVMGTPAFMSPEQAMGRIEELDARSDVYSLGATLYVLLTGRRPFEGKTVVEVVMNVINRDPPPPRKLNSKIPAPVEAIVLKAMEKDPNRRYQTAADFSADVQRYLSNLEVEARLPSLLTLFLRKVRRNPWPVAMGLVLVAAAAIAFFGYRGRRTADPTPETRSGTMTQPARDWLKEFRFVREPLELETYVVGDKELPARVRRILAEIEEPDSEDARSAWNWFREQADLAKAKAAGWVIRPRSEWLGPEVQVDAARLQAWCVAALEALEGAKGQLSTVAEDLMTISKSVDPVLSYRGEFTLMVGLAPYAEVRIMQGGREVARDTTPFRKTLDVADYEVELTAPDLPAIKKSLSGIKNGSAYWIKGDMRKPVSVIVSSAP